MYKSVRNRHTVSKVSTTHTQVVYADSRRNRINAGHMHSLTEVKSEQPEEKFCKHTGEMENARLSHLSRIVFTSFINFTSARWFLIMFISIRYATINNSYIFRIFDDTSQCAYSIVSRTIGIC